jgi:hypothetical protein
MVLQKSQSNGIHIHFAQPLDSVVVVSIQMKLLFILGFAMVRKVLDMFKLANFFIKYNIKDLAS